MRPPTRLPLWLGACRPVARVPASPLCTNSHRFVFTALLPAHLSACLPAYLLVALSAKFSLYLVELPYCPSMACAPRPPACLPAHTAPLSSNPQCSTPLTRPVLPAQPSSLLPCSGAWLVWRDPQLL